VKHVDRKLRTSGNNPKNRNALGGERRDDLKELSQCSRLSIIDQTQVGRCHVRSDRIRCLEPGSEKEMDAAPPCRGRSLVIEGGRKEAHSVLNGAIALKQVLMGLVRGAT